MSDQSINDTAGDQRRGLLAVQHLPQWFVAGFALVYVSGYLIDFYYSSSLGITENGGDLLKLKYIQVGLNFVLFFLILSGPSFFDVQHFIGWIFDPSSTKKDFTNRAVRFCISFFTITYILSIYSSFIFTPWHYFQQDPRRIYAILALIFIVQALYIFAVTVIERAAGMYASDAFVASEIKLKGKLYRLIGKHDSISRIVLTLGLTAVVGYCDYRAFKDLRATIYECIITNRGFIFFVICLLFGVLLHRTIRRMENPPVHPARYLAVMMTNLLVIFYLGLVSYAYNIFPYVPNIKGGADFTNAPLSSVTFKDTNAGSEHPEVLQNAIHVYSTPLAAFFAVPTIGNDACDWRSRIAFPRLIQIQQEAIKQINVTPQNLEKESNCFLRNDVKKKSNLPSQ